VQKCRVHNLANLIGLCLDQLSLKYLIIQALWANDRSVIRQRPNNSNDLISSQQLNISLLAAECALDLEYFPADSFQQHWQLWIRLIDLIPPNFGYKVPPSLPLYPKLSEHMLSLLSACLLVRFLPYMNRMSRSRP
jgi:hypothetical protein